MISLLLAAATSLVIALVGTPFLIRLLRARGIGQLIREDGPSGHQTKAGTPTMGGIAILGGTVGGYLVGSLRPGGDGLSRPGLCLLGLVLGLGAVGFIDDYLGIRFQRNLGLNKRAKSAGQLVIAAVFALLAVRWIGVSTEVSFTRDLGLDLGGWGFAVWAVVIIIATANAVNLTDGLDGLASGASAFVAAAFVIIAFWQVRHGALYRVEPADALGLAVVAAAILGGCAGFLWWNAAPARIFMGDTGSLALGGALAGLALLTRTHLLLPILGGLFVLETVSVVIQVVSFRGFGRRVFRMAPIHHHFELAGWPEFTVIVRFWLITGLFVAFGLGLFYADFIASGALD
ncbi:MAG: phospho-N-acetylmuramoyl-pentapeptide-transferase [Actinomycetota bacterium]|nr:phospho-N-acetylmuramoyl-pentapeptide-transferase [Actinomycetota bacterium]